jgi:pimeloyl-ACP methyl ester carboxylesterase
VAGLPPFNYQWQFNGQNIPNATSATLTLNSVTASNDGGYSVVVWNSYGSATSTTASLAVLTDGANGNTPTQITATPIPSKPIGVTKLVVITHGWEPEGPGADVSWIVDMQAAINQHIGSDYLVVPYDWVGSKFTQGAWTADPQDALNNAENIGTQLGKQIGSTSFQYVHLIGHSAGAGLIQAAADAIRQASPSTVIQTTFLDPFMGLFGESQNYGKNADWSDCYFVEDGTGGFTSGYLNHAFNVDVSWVDPAHKTAPYFGFGGGEVALSSHGYSYNFYLGSITGGNSSCSSAYGFPLSREMEGVFWFNNQANYPVGSGPFLPCSPPDAVKNPNPGIAGLESGAAGAWAVITDIPHALSQAGATLIGNAGAELHSIWSALPLVKSGGIQPADNTANTPAWLAMGLTVTNAVNFVQFDAAFTDTNAAQGLLTVYWNTNQLGMVDERVAATNLQTYRFTLPNIVSSGLYTLSFRLDSFDNSSSIAVTNVATGFVGVTNPITLGISFTNSRPMLQLTAATNFNYLVQSSTNLVDWTPTALLLNTNGTAQFIDSAVTNSGARFYRVTMP